MRPRTLLLALLLCGCHAHGGTDADLGDDGDVDAAGQIIDGFLPSDFAGADLATGPIVVTPDPLDFGPVLNKTSATLPVTITNPGGAPITIQSATITGAAFSADTSGLPATLAAGESRTLQITFAPMMGGTQNGVLSLAHDGAGSPAMVPITGVSTHAVTLTWNASASPNVKGYNIYRGATMGGPYGAKVNTMLVPVLTFSDTNVASCAKYFYVATAVDNTGAESGYSNEAPTVIPCP
jgi:hypothetical protein